MKWLAISLLLFFSLQSGCDLRTRETDLDQRETALEQRGQELNIKERTLQIKEQELIKREQKLDSSIKTDTVNLYNPAIIGIWSVKMTCTETTCAESAVGDTKNEQWNISYEANTIVARAMADEKLIRTYTGTPKAEVIELTEQQHNVASNPSTRMIVRITVTGTKSMEGQREIIRNNCKVIYALQMDRTSNTKEG